MWRIGVTAVLVVLIIENSVADNQYGNIVHRLRRSPYYRDCPPPPYWPPPPPPHWGHRPHRYWEQRQPYRESYSAANAASNSGSQQQPPCDSCGGGNGGAAVSNAQSDTGSAIAVAVAKANGH
ncbi:uncharacterized protein LOC131851877 [Achroia grisella]|uniref:uncharacterized protein LOC131851877 n=1 Tax=Achroia grisella TaxID=688607 RepID=UPI0027D2211B|nr:uncharacterized protein LOC131851877 [Achroia grisella]